MVRSVSASKVLTLPPNMFGTWPSKKERVTAEDGPVRMRSPDATTWPCTAKCQASLPDGNTWTVPLTPVKVAV
jgi:hypothetical protein